MTTNLTELAFETLDEGAQAFLQDRLAHDSLSLLIERRFSSAVDILNNLLTTGLSHGLSLFSNCLLNSYLYQ